MTVRVAERASGRCRQNVHFACHGYARMTTGYLKGICPCKCHSLAMNVASASVPARGSGTQQPP